MNDFDIAAAKAKADLDAMDLKDLTADKLTIWFEAWYMTAGHKRLGRILVARAKALAA